MNKLLCRVNLVLGHCFLVDCVWAILSGIKDSKCAKFKIKRKQKQRQNKTELDTRHL